MGRCLFGFNIDPVGHHNGAWRHPDVDPQRFFDIEEEVNLAATAEAAGFDMVFMADGLALRDDDEGTYALPWEPLTMFSAVAARTSTIGVVLTVSSTFTEPYNLARYMTSLDHLSRGRAAWNVVTTAHDVAPLNFGHVALPDHADRYRRADEFVHVVRGLWRGWAPGALLLDQKSGRYYDADRVSPVNVESEFYRVRGPLNMPPGPQGEPVIVQAGQSEDGRSFAARHADVVYTIAQRLDDAIAYYQDIKRRAADYGRDPDAVKVILSVRVLVEPSTDAAVERAEHLSELLPLERTVERVSGMIEVDMTRLPLEAPIPKLPDPEGVNKFQTQLRMIAALVEAGEIRTIRDLAVRMNGGQGVLSITGAGADVADELQRWYQAGAVDGFMILPQVTQLDGPKFVDLVVPELKARGLMVEPKTTRTFRERLLA